MLRVVVEDLVASGTAVTGCGEDFSAACAASDARVSAALPGWQGRSGIALTALGEQWTELGRAVVVRLAEVAEGLFASARAFRVDEQGGSEEFSALG